MFISILYMFWAAMCPSSGELLYQCDIWFMSLCVDDRPHSRNMYRIEINIHEKLCIRLVIYKDHIRMHSQQDIKVFMKHL